MAATAAQLDGPNTGRRPSCRAGHIRSDHHGEDARSETPRLAARPGSMPAAAAPASDLVLPPLDVRALARRAAMPVALALVVAAAVIVAGGPLRTFADALGRALQADPRWVGAGAAFELVSFAGYVALLWLVSARATPR